MRVSVDVDLTSVSRAIRLTVMILLQIGAFVWYALGAEYGYAAETGALKEHHLTSGDALTAADAGMTYVYAGQDGLYFSSGVGNLLLFTFIQLFVFVGLGLLMGTLKSYGYTTSGYVLCLGAVVLQWGILINGFFANAFQDKDLYPNYEWIKVQMTSNRFLDADYGFVALLVTLGALLGKVSLEQGMVVTFFHMVFYAINNNLCRVTMAAADVGGTLTVHLFGAYFGLIASKFITNSDKAKKIAADGNQDRWAIFGTLLLFVLFPAWNAVYAGTSEGAIERVVVHTVLALVNSVIASFAFSKALRGGDKFNVVDVQKATVAGGVAIGACSNLVIFPFAAMLIGFAAGFVAVLGSVYVQPLLEGWGLHDSTGVHNLHGLPAWIGAIACWIAIATMNTDNYTKADGTAGDLELLLPQMKHNGAVAANAAAGTPAIGGDGWKGRDKGEQGLAQFAAIGITLGISLFGGAIAGFIASKLPGMTTVKKYMAVYDWV
jgi:ammonium transporter Rh